MSSREQTNAQSTWNVDGIVANEGHKAPNHSHYPVSRNPRCILYPADCYHGSLAVCVGEEVVRGCSAGARKMRMKPKLRNQGENKISVQVYPREIDDDEDFWARKSLLLLMEGLLCYSIEEGGEVNFGSFSITPVDILLLLLNKKDFKCIQNMI